MADPREPEDDIDGIEDEADEGLDEGSDAGSIDDQGGDDAQGDGQEDEVQARQERVSRPRDNRIRDEIRALREHNARVEQEIQNLRQQAQQAQQPREESDAEFEARVSVLDSDDRQRARLDRATLQHRQQLARQAFMLADRMDKMNYDNIAKTDPIYRKYANDVEQLLAAERNKGHDINRETALDYLRGRNARLKQKAASAPAPRRAPPQQTRTTGGRGDQPREERRERRYAANDMSPEAVKQRLFRDDAFI